MLCVLEETLNYSDMYDLWMSIVLVQYHDFWACGQCRIKYYNGCLFHMVQKDFTAQTGDPTATGTGGDSVYK